MTFTNKQLIGMGVAALVIGWYVRRQTIETAKEVAQAVNPVNPDNVINAWFEDAYQRVTGSERTPGGDLYHWLHGVDG